MREGVVSWSGHKPVIEEPAIRLRGRGPSVSNIVIEMRQDREQALLASALELRATGEELWFACWDEGLRKAAHAEGLATLPAR
jgi:hypothetical protein